MPRIVMHSYSHSQPLLISASTLSGCLDVASEHGFDLAPQLAKHDLALDVAEDPRGQLPFHTIADFLEDVAIQQNCQLFGFLVAHKQQPLLLGLLSQLPRFCATVGEALTLFHRYQRLYSQTASWEMIPEDGCMAMRRLETFTYSRSFDQLKMFSVALSVKTIKRLAGGEWGPDAVHLTCSPPDDPSPMRQFFECPLFFNSHFNGAIYPADIVNLPVSSSNPQMLRALIDYLDPLLSSERVKPGRVDEVYRKILLSVGEEDISLASVAGRMGRHPRAVQRDLAASGTSFRQLVLGAYMEMAKGFLRSPNISVAEVSDLLGYRNLSSFSRAFERECGIRPTTYRKQCQTRQL